MMMRVTLALIAIAAVGATGWGLTRGRHLQHFQTAQSEQKGLELADGSIVQVNGDSAISVELTSRERNINLSRGEARFRVAKDRSRPFLVYTPFATVRAVGTIFNVRIDSGRTSVTVVEGEVEIVGEDADQPLLRTLIQPFSGKSADVDGRIRLRAGQNASAASKRSLAINDGPSIEKVNAWPVRLVSMQDKKLADLVAELNRYRSQPIVIADPEVAGLEVNGSVNVYEPDSILDFLAVKHHVLVERKADGRIILMKGRKTRQRATD